jgi:hypothetical protein
MLRVFRGEIFNSRTLGGGMEELQVGPGLVSISFDRDMRIIEMDKFMTV